VHEFGPKAAPTQVLVRGSAATPGKEVVPRFVQVLCASAEAAEPRLPTAARDAKSTGRRRLLADWIASPANPLTARVLVNRLWHHHFGRGIVATPSDFGKTGLPPSHPELLDWLASEFIAGGWRIKPLHRRILLSETYRQSSRAGDERAMRVDPGNALLWRQNLRRLEAEAIRDAILAVSGELNLAMGGRGFFPTLPREVLATQSKPGNGWGHSPPREQARRSVYIFVKRTLGVPFLESFDVASPDTSTPSRAVTTIAPQALILLNSQFMEEQSLACAERLLRETGTEPEGNVARMFRLALGRQPTPRELEIAAGFVRRERAGDRRLALARLCKIVLNLNEMIYID